MCLSRTSRGVLGRKKLQIPKYFLNVHEQLNPFFGCQIVYYWLSKASPFVLKYIPLCLIPPPQYVNGL